MTEKPSGRNDVVAIMEILAQEAVAGAGPTELAKRLGMDKATVYRRLSELVESGWLERVEGGNYVPSIQFGRVAETVRKSYIAHADVITRRLAALDAAAPSGM